ncbi:hypothetical protein D8666_09455 [Ochrobactrum soli]|uniref:protein-disulfide reductase DsbD domain-containing protein n=1 Tax=Brucella/Ochrobactrum group TaxID=2826938 RepID=UPI000EF1DC72|nr:MULTISPECIES: protein-disulfide reductase DsbD domain-containing protein [Brucella]MCI1001141.1 hypothetical protein [Ochrobactrum sp. C6C9]MDX4076404.1 protein-disulfide reductase DsbD family protein [Brucella sp. NBRC 113783]RLL75472.1 hypothetical protein D8666_09455 [[Ochrobactrum] soli]WHT40976.1 protein-disulfide reductase DsbD family protein [Ochrobactrum sp. SSR]
MKTRLNILAFGLLATSALPAHASTSAWTDTPGGRVRVIIEDGAVSAEAGPKREIRGALQIELQPGWKTYWRNPGSAGVPPQINLDGNANAQIDYPAPVRFGGDDDGIGYKKPVSLPIIFKLQPDDTRLKGHAFLGVCEHICIPVQAEFDFPVSANAESAEPQAIAARTIVETAFGRLPATASPTFGVSAVKRDEDTAVFTVAVPDPKAPAELFVASDKLRLSDPVASGNRNFTVTIKGNARYATVDYTVVQNGKAVSGQVTLD